MNLYHYGLYTTVDPRTVQGLWAQTPVQSKIWVELFFFKSVQLLIPPKCNYQ